MRHCVERPDHRVGGRGKKEICALIVVEREIVATYSISVPSLLHATGNNVPPTPRK